VQAAPSVTHTADCSVLRTPQTHTHMLAPTNCIQHTVMLQHGQTITNHNEVTYHFLRSIFEHLHITKQTSHQP
jgi:hypothetical protein